MKTIINTILIAFISLTFSGITWAQDASFTQFNESRLYINPAYASNERFTEVSLGFRTQWRKVAVPYQTTYLSGIHPIYSNGVKKRRVAGIGVTLFNDQAGVSEIRTLGANFSASKLIRISRDYKHIISFGVQGGFFHRRLNLENLRLAEQYEDFVGFNSNIIPTEFTSDFSNRTTFADFGAGFLYSFNNTQAYSRGKMSGYLGGAISHLNEPNESFSNTVSRLSRNSRLHAGITVPVTRDLYVAPNVLIEGQSNTVLINSNVEIFYNLRYQSNKTYLNKLIAIAGVGTRLQDAVYLKLGLSSEMIDLGYTYDITSSNLNESTSRVGASEISLTIKRPVNTIRHADTPRK